ncbi:OmpH family outer membrane protein [Terracidiphilus sp.]|jgi:outer membrane protein|uniref:OmpH family outer membrane protein n=1 Tax=Terracidiphilus sp. TaxID=1964191 RepID=UPI003C1E6C48
MKRVSAIAAVFGAALTVGAAGNVTAQTPAAAPAPASAKVAVIAFQTAVTATNEFQRDFGDVQKKFEPQRSQLQTLGNEVDSLTKQLQAQGASLGDAERASKAKTLDDKKKAAQRLAEDANNDYQQAIQETFGKVAQKVEELLEGYSKQQGFTLVIDESQDQQQAPLVLYRADTVDITKVVVDAYNVKSGVPAPPPQAPNAPAPTARPAAKTPPAK